MNDITIIACAGFATGITTVLFGFGGGFVVVPLLYQLFLRQPALLHHALQSAIATSTAVMIFNAGAATINNYRAGKLSLSFILPWCGYIGAGAIVGSLLADALPENTVRILFVLYMLVTISDCVIGRRFLEGGEQRILSSFTTKVGGSIIGTIAALLGVGGSVMTVPLLRKHGYAMSSCIVNANALSLPVALCGAITYAIKGRHKVPVEGFIGYISLPTLLILIVTGWLGIGISRRYLPVIADRWHARIYVLLLILVLVAMLV